jgi:hypothetical protein
MTEAIEIGLLVAAVTVATRLGPICALLFSART